MEAIESQNMEAMAKEITKPVQTPLAAALVVKKPPMAAPKTEAAQRPAVIPCKKKHPVNLRAQVKYKLVNAR